MSSTGIRTRSATPIQKRAKLTATMAVKTTTPKTKEAKMAMGMKERRSCTKRNDCRGASSVSNWPTTTMAQLGKEWDFLQL